MNIYQRIVLIAGAIVLVVAIWTTPMGFKAPQKGWLTYPKNYAETKKAGAALPERHFRTVIVRSIGIMGATLLVFFALKGIGNKEK